MAGAELATRVAPAANSKVLIFLSSLNGLIEQSAAAASPEACVFRAMERPLRCGAALQRGEALATQQPLSGDRHEPQGIRSVAHAADEAGGSAARADHPDGREDEGAG